LTFNVKQRAAIQRWMGQAVPLKGVYVRSAGYRCMDPADLLSGTGTRACGGRFAAVGIRAVYLSATDSGAGKEVTARKARLGEAAQISTGKYPRVVYAVGVNPRPVDTASNCARPGVPRPV
jgi:RES domain-containing protein